MLSGPRVPKTFAGTDADGDQYTVTLSGPGAINVVANAGVAPAIQTIYLQGTNASSILTVAVTKKIGDGLVDIGRITGSGPGRITAAHSDLTGTGVDLSGGLGVLSLHDIQSGAGIHVGVPGQATTLDAHVIQDGTTIAAAGSLSLKAASIGADTITAAKLTTLNITGDTTLGISGNMTGAAITLTGTHTALGTLTVAGQISGANIKIPNGSVTSFTVTGSLNTSTIQVGGTVSLLRAASMDTDTITAARVTTLKVPGNSSRAISGNLTASTITLTGTGTALGTTTIAGQVSGSDIQVTMGSVSSFKAAAFTDSTLFLGQGTFAFGGAGGTITPNQHIGSFTITDTSAAFSNSNVAAYVVGTVTLGSLQTNNGGHAFGIEAQVQQLYPFRVSVHVVSPLFTYNPKGSHQQGVGDFQVYLV